MNTSPAIDFRQAARECVDHMGDIFWDYDERRDVSLGLRNPREIAMETVERTLRELASGANIADQGKSILQVEYETMLFELPDAPTDEQIIEWLVAESGWTARGAREVLQLARRYGMSILRNALGLAAAMQIEDGSEGL